MQTPSRTPFPDPVDVRALTELLGLMANFRSDEQRARYLLSSNWMRDRGAIVAARNAEFLGSLELDVPVRRGGVMAVELLERKRKGTLPFDLKADLNARDVITERLYRCDNGWSLGARRGGRLHLADKDTWEIFVLDPVGIAHGDSVGWVSEEQLALAAERLAAWPMPEVRS